MQRSLITILLSIFIIIGTSSLSYSKGKFVNINGIKMYYEIYGTGEPLLLLHGGLGNIHSFNKQIPVFKENFKVIVPEFRGRGRSTDSKQPITYELMTSDTVELINYLKLKSVHVVGVSDGAIIGLNLAISYPEKVKKLVSVAANYNVDGIEEDTIKAIRDSSPEEIFPEIFVQYKKMAPEPDHWPILVDKLKEMMLTSPDFNTDMLANIKTQTLILVGDRDGFVRLNHTIQLFKSIPNSQLCVIPSSTHSVYSEKPELFNQIIINFLQTGASKQRH